MEEMIHDVEKELQEIEDKEVKNKITEKRIGYDEERTEKELTQY